MNERIFWSLRSKHFFPVTMLSSIQWRHMYARSNDLQNKCMRMCICVRILPYIHNCKKRGAETFGTAWAFYFSKTIHAFEYTDEYCSFMVQRHLLVKHQCKHIKTTPARYVHMKWNEWNGYLRIYFSNSHHIYSVIRCSAIDYIIILI